MKRYVLDNARMILRAAGLDKEELAVALNRVYRHYSGDDIFAIAGITFENHYFNKPIRKPMLDEREYAQQLEFAALGKEGGEK